MRARRVSVVLAASALLASCADADASRMSTVTPVASADGGTSVASPRSASPSPRAPVAKPVTLPVLPRQGVAVERHGGVVFVDLEGDVVARLPGFHLEYTWTVPGPIVLRRHPHEFFVLREGTHVVVPIGDRDAAARVSPQFQPGFEPDADPGLPYPAGTRVEGHPELRSGWWVYALPSPDGSRLLAQWSGECEVPNAFFIEGRSVLTVDGFPRITPAADSWALGWTSDGRGVALLSGGPCSSPFARPGVYLLEGPGEGEFLVPAANSVRMWGAA
jgi:hypothetical protein